ncbi:hypothetical protein [Ramlibacter sp. AN1133]|uniref:hypothetical protein n=1 Tax=Ramlibacter sp. AN1133 TaxID=3133429 RepID=UPI0030C39E32
MNRYEVALLAPAKEEITEAFLWYFERSPVAARAFRTEVFAGIDRGASTSTPWLLATALKVCRRSLPSP